MSDIPAQIKQSVERTVEFLKQNGISNEEFLKQKHRNNPDFAFLFPESKYHSYYRSLLDNTNEMQIESEPQQFQPQTFQQQPPPTHSQQQPTHPQQTHNERKSRWNDAPLPTINSLQENQAGKNKFQNLQFTGNNPNPLQGFPNQMPMQNINNQGPFFTQAFPFFNPSNLQGFPNNQTGFMPMQINVASNLMPHTSININQRTSGSREPKPSVSTVNKTPEDIPCGMMADMIRQQIKKLKDSHQQTSYVPLDPFLTPQTINPPNADKVSEYYKSKLDSLRKFIDEERYLVVFVNELKGNAASRELENRTKKSRKTKESDAEPEQSKNIGKSRDSRDSRESRESSRRERNYDNSGNTSGEFGMRADGQSVDTFYGETRQGLGMLNEDIYSKFRKSRSSHYHTSAEERSLTRDQPDLCYVCHMPGHIARDCKFGLT